MKRLAPIAAIALGSMLLIGCESEDVARIARNRHTCAMLSARVISDEYADELLDLPVPTHDRDYCKALLGHEMRMR